MTDNFVETPADQASDRHQIIAAVILGIAATLTALASFNAALADGEALEGYTKSMLHLNDANAFYAQANSVSSADQALFIQYAMADEEGRTDLAAYLETLMRPELRDAVQWLIDTEEAVTPFDAIEGNRYGGRHRPGRIARRSGQAGVLGRCERR